MVHVGGDVTTCCLDEHLVNRLGNLREQPLSEIWDSETLNRWRLAQVEGRFADSGPLCTRCNWQSAGAYPDDKVQGWLTRKGWKVRPARR
jgi:radical SAM protein with 4Fe4S-binding SPASM domain